MSAAELPTRGDGCTASLFDEKPPRHRGSPWFAEENRCRPFQSRPWSERLKNAVEFVEETRVSTSTWRFVLSQWCVRTGSCAASRVLATRRRPRTWVGSHKAQTQSFRRGRRHGESLRSMSFEIQCVLILFQTNGFDANVGPHGNLYCLTT